MSPRTLCWSGGSTDADPRQLGTDCPAARPGAGASGTRETLLVKCQHKGLTFSGSDDFLAPARLAEAQRYWERDLQEEAASLPAFSAVATTLRPLLKDFLSGVEIL